MPERVTTGWFCDASKAHCLVHCFLNRILAQVMPAALTRARVGRERGGWKNVLPRPFTICVGKFARQRVGQIDATIGGGYISEMNFRYARQMLFQIRFDSFPAPS